MSNNKRKRDGEESEENKKQKQEQEPTDEQNTLASDLLCSIIWGIDEVKTIVNDKLAETIMDVFLDTYARFVASHPEETQKEIARRIEDGEAYPSAIDVLKNRQVRAALATAFTVLKEMHYKDYAEDVEHDTDVYLDACCKALCKCTGLTKMQAVIYLSNQFCYYARGQALVERGQVKALKRTLEWIKQNQVADFDLGVYVNELPYSQFRSGGTILEAIGRDPGVLRQAATHYFCGKDVETEDTEELGSSEFKEEPTTDSEENVFFE